MPEKLMKRVFLPFIFLVICFCMIYSNSAGADSPSIIVLEAKGTINPVLAKYIERGISISQSRNTTACIIMLDTPGGLDTAMRDIVQNIVNSKTPVVVFVSPAGARAASAGVFITLAAHVAIMAPNTTIGAAHPVAIGSSGEVTQMSKEMESKVLNDAVAYIRGLAQSQDRNVDWAEDAVRKSVAVPAEKAVELKVVDLIANDLNDLVNKIDGRQVTMLDRTKLTIKTADAIIKPIPMNAVEKFLFAISDPNIAYLLLSLGMLGIFLELLHPGVIFPGVIGAISLFLSLYSLGMLPVNYAGLLLILLAFGLFIADVFLTSHGILTAGGIASLVLGSLILFSGRSSMFRINPGLIAGVVIVITLFFIFIVGAVIKGQRRRATTGREGMIGKKAIAKSTLSPTGIVLAEGENWSAISEIGEIQQGDEVIITKVEGLKLWVKKV